MNFDKYSEIVIKSQITNQEYWEKKNILKIQKKKYQIYSWEVK